MIQSESPREDLEQATQFTLFCLRSRLDPTALAAAREVALEVNWDAWVDAVQAEGLAPLLYRILRTHDIAPATVEARLEDAYFRCARANVLRFHELDRALQGLAEAGVQTILLKGAALAETVYGDVGVRPMDDLDLLVRREQVPSALQALKGLGYGAVGIEAQPGTAMEFENEIVLTNAGARNTMIELHWGLVDSPYYQQKLDAEWFWESAVEPHLLPPLLGVEGELAQGRVAPHSLPSSAGGEGSRVLGVEALVLYLCAHLALHHHGHGLRWLHDIAEVLSRFRDRIAWDLLLAKAAEYDLVLPLQQILPRVVEGWNAPVPAGIPERLQDMQPSDEEARVFNWLSTGRRPVAQRFLADLVSMPGWRPRLRYGLGNLFPSADYMRHRYNLRHGFLLPFSYPYRWLVGLRGALPHPKNG